jgi:hypothetical protein
MIYIYKDNFDLTLIKTGDILKIEYNQYKFIVDVLSSLHNRVDKIDISLFKNTNDLLYNLFICKL